MKSNIIIFFLLFFPGLVGLQTLAAEYYYVDSSINGDDNHEGTISSPWKTISYGISQLASGDTLFVKPGNYRESYLGIKYAVCNGITLKALGGKATISNDIAEFNDANSGDWETYDSTKKIYCSTDSYAGATGNNYAFGYFLYLGKNYKLVPYTSWTAFTSATDTEGNYIGPGTFYDVNGLYGTAGKIYIRLAKTEQMTALNLGNIENSTPDNLKIYLSVNPFWLQIWKANHVTFDGFTISNGKITIGGDSTFPPSNTTVSNCSITGFYAPSHAATIVIGTSAADCTLDRIYMTDNFPEWICWNDVKIFSQNYSLMNTAVQITCNGMAMRGCYIKNTHDGIWATSGGCDWDIHHNVFQNIQDDGIQLNSDTARINIHHNAFVDCGTSVSKNAYAGVPDNPDPGKKYIHHNLIDTRKPRYWFRRNSLGSFYGGDASGKVCLEAFGQHSFLEAGYYKDPRKVYNNTILAGNAIGAGRYGSNIAGVQTVYKHEIYNNIMYVAIPDGLTGYLEKAQDESDPDNHSTIYDGNCHYFIGTQTDTDSLYLPYMLEGIADIADFNDFRYHSNNTWETDGAWLNPAFNSDNVPQASGIDNVGVDISNNAWPDIIDTNYCGGFSRFFGNSIIKLDPVVENAGFENDYSDTWSCSTGVTRDQNEHHRGIYSLKITSASTVLRSAEFKTTQTVIPGRDYKARVYVKGNNIGTASYGALMKFVYLKEDGSWVNGTQTVAKNGTFDWQELTATSTAPANTVAVKLRLCLYDIGTVWFDNVQLFQTPNICPNPGFESDLSCDYVTGYFSQTTDCSYSGKSSLSCTTAVDGFAQASTVMERLPVTPGKKIKVTIYAKTNNVTGSSTKGAQIKTLFYNSTGSYLGDSSRLSSSLISGTNDWTMLKNEGTIPANAAYAVITMRLYGMGTVWFDDLHVFHE